MRKQNLIIEGLRENQYEKEGSAEDQVFYFVRDTLGLQRLIWPIVWGSPDMAHVQCLYASLVWGTEWRCGELGLVQEILSS